MELNEKFVLRNIYGKSLLVPICKNNITQNVISLNLTSSMIFENCSKFDSAVELGKYIASKFSSNEEILADLEEYIDMLIKQGFLVK